jgi:hypothetical protein
MSEILLLISLILLSASKLADLWTTVHHVGRYGEMNPLARFMFAKVGFACGLALVMVLWAVIVGMVYASAWSAPWWIQVVKPLPERWSRGFSGMSRDSMRHAGAAV